MKIYTYSSTSVDVTVSEGSKWYTYVLPKDKGLYRIEGDYVTKVVVKADINTSNGVIIIPTSTIESSFKGSNTSNVTNMNDMFAYCRSLTSLDLSKWDTSKVDSMFDMFNGCRSLTSLDVSSFNTSNVTNMSAMFMNCIGLTSLDLSNFNTSKVTDMSDMFDSCASLTSLDLSGWNTSNVTNMGTMFYGCEVLREIKMVGCSPSTINKIKAQLTTDGISLDKVNIITE